MATSLKRQRSYHLNPNSVSPSGMSVLFFHSIDFAHGITCFVCSGGGPGGLALAVTLGKYNDPTCPIAIDIYESQPKLATVGAGISVWPRTHTLLRRLGVMDMLKGELGMETDATDAEGMWSS